MTQQKDLKRLVRTRMEKTGESYTAARSILLAKKTRATVAAPPAEEPDDATRAGLSDEAVKAKTGCTWETWVRSLDAHDMASKPHREIARFVQERYGLGGWWAQTVTVGYERIKGLREIGQLRSGGYVVNKSKTFPVPVAELYHACRDRRLQRRWLPGIELRVRTATPNHSLRISWPDGTSVELGLTAKSDAKSSVAVQHNGLASKADAEASKVYWAERLAALGELLAAG